MKGNDEGGVQVYEIGNNEPMNIHWLNEEE